MSNHNKPQPPKPLMKQHSLPADVIRNKAWLKKKKKRHALDCLLRSKGCVRNDDIEELKGCFDLGFGFETDSPHFSPRLSKTIPALDLLCRQFNNHLSLTSSSPSEGGDSNSSSTTIVNKGDERKMMKKKLKQWAKVVACSVRHSSSGKPN